MYVILAYDVVEDRRRGRFFKRLKKYLVPVQKSVFEGNLPPARLARVQELVHKELDLETDSVRIYQVCKGCRGLIVQMGVAVVPREEEEPIIV